MLEDRNDMQPVLVQKYVSASAARPDAHTKKEFAHASKTNKLKTDTLASVLCGNNCDKQTKKETKRNGRNGTRRSSTKGCVGVRGCSCTASSQSGMAEDRSVSYGGSLEPLWD